MTCSCGSSSGPWTDFWRSDSAFWPNSWDTKDRRAKVPCIGNNGWPALDRTFRQCSLGVRRWLDHAVWSYPACQALRRASSRAWTFQLWAEYLCWSESWWLALGCALAPKSARSPLLSLVFEQIFYVWKWFLFKITWITQDKRD